MENIVEENFRCMDHKHGIALEHTILTVTVGAICAVLLMKLRLLKSTAGTNAFGVKGKKRKQTIAWTYNRLIVS